MLHKADEARVLVIYTGGTIGMLVGHQGYVPEPYFLTETLRSQAKFHDPLQDSLFSHSASVQGFRSFRKSSGRSSPVASAFATTAPSQLDLEQATLCVRSSRPIGNPAFLDVEAQSERDHIHCVKLNENLYEAQVPSLVTPKSAVSGGESSKTIRYAILEWNPLLDSSNIDIDDWIRISTEVELNYANFDAFVILHGTDTMSYTASALSFLLEDLGKTVIITGAQIPLSQLRNDATDNLMGALMIAGHYLIPECCLYFNHTLFRGNRVSKTSSYDLGAFTSPNFNPLVNATLRLFPGITAATVSAFFNPPIRGIVLETFGAGNAPQRKDLMDAIRSACHRGVVIVAISQCAKGSVSDAYETGRTLLQSGVIPGGDMTPECALTKLSYLLSKPELSTEEVRRLMGTPLRGELTRMNKISAKQPAIDNNLDNIQGMLAQFVRLSAPQSVQPSITVTGPGVSEPALDTKVDAGAPWTWTVAEASSTEAVLYPFLAHLATSKNDCEALRNCLDAADAQAEAISDATPASSFGNVAGGLVNSIDRGSGRSLLHVAALNGHYECVDILLQRGALVHLRDTLGHTALYYAARQGHREIVSLLVSTGATLSGVDTNFVSFELAAKVNNADALAVWSLAGVAVDGVAT